MHIEWPLSRGVMYVLLSFSYNWCLNTWRSQHSPEVLVKYFFILLYTFIWQLVTGYFADSYISLKKTTSLYIKPREQNGQYQPLVESNWAHIQYVHISIAVKYNFEVCTWRFPFYLFIYLLLCILHLYIFVIFTTNHYI